MNDIDALLANLRQLGNDTATCEVKKASGGLPATLWETISAFANAQGGQILLGIDEKAGFRVVGVDDPGAMEARLGSICSEMEPPVRAEISTCQVDGQSVVVVIIPPTPRDQRPCHKKSRGPWDGSRIRVTDGDRKLTDYEIAVLLSNRTEPRHDCEPAYGASQEDLDQDMLAVFLERIRETKGEIFRKIEDNKALIMLNVLTVHEGVLVPTLAGLLAFGTYPQMFEPQLDITFVAYPTTTPGVLGTGGERFTENRSIDGSIPLMVKECIHILKRNMKRRSIVAGIYRVDAWEYPEEVLREALVNALVHRDYTPAARGTQVQVEMYPDRLVIRNPGGLYGPVDVSSLGTSTVTASRNKALLKILEDTPFGDGHMVCENRGSGIASIRIALTEAGMEPPQFVDSIASFTASFPNNTLLDEDALSWLRSLDDQPLTRSQMIALTWMRNGRTLSNADYRGLTGIYDSRIASRELRELVDRKLINQHGTRGNAIYSIADNSGRGMTDLLTTLPQAESPLTTGRHSLTKNEHDVIAALQKHDLSRAEIEGITGLATYQVRRTLAALRSMGYVRMIGKQRSRSTRWSLVPRD